MASLPISKVTNHSHITKHLHEMHRISPTRLEHQLVSCHAHCLLCACVSRVRTCTLNRGQKTDPTPCGICVFAFCAEPPGCVCISRGVALAGRIKMIHKLIVVVWWPVDLTN